MTIDLLTEAGLSECARAPEVPACKELNDGLFVMFVAGPIAAFSVLAVIVLLLVITSWHSEIENNEPAEEWSPAPIRR